MVRLLRGSLGLGQCWGSRPQGKFHVQAQDYFGLGFRVEGLGLGVYSVLQLGQEGMHFRCERECRFPISIASQSVVGATGFKMQSKTTVFCTASS